MREQASNHEEMRHEVHEDFEHRAHREHGGCSTGRRRRLPWRKTAHEHRRVVMSGARAWSFAAAAARYAGRPVEQQFVSFVIFVSFVVKVPVLSVFDGSVSSAPVFSAA